jgi:ribosomal protein L32
MVKVVSLFLIFILVLAMFGRLRLPKIQNPLKREKVQPSVKCSKCGRYNLAGEACACGKGK